MNSRLREKFRKLKINSIQTNVSFDRFSDDLTEQIVGYLTIEDKFRFECLSKQIRNKIFVNQTHLELGSDSDLSSKLVIKIWSKVNYPVLEKVLRKLNYLTDIELKDGIEVDAEVLKLIANNCHHLQRLSLNASAYDLTCDDITCFGRKCGSNIKSLYLNTNLPEELSMTLLSWTPNLTSLSLDRHGNMQQHDWLEDLKSFQKLRHLTLALDLTDDDLVKIGQNLPHLESIDIRTVKPITDKTFESLSQLKSLKSVNTLNASNVLVTNSGVKQLLDNCLHLRRLEISKKSNFYFSLDTIHTIISRAKERPNILYRFVFCVKNYQKFEKAFSNLPKNLVLKFRSPLNL